MGRIVYRASAVAQGDAWCLVGQVRASASPNWGRRKVGRSGILSDLQKAVQPV